jgi:type II secretory pathway component PulC
MGFTTGIRGCLVASAAGLLGAGLAQQPATDVPLSGLPLQLTGIIVDKDIPARSACIIRCTDGSERRGMFYAGHRACDLAEIQEVREDGVLIRNLLTSRPEILVFPVAAGSAATQPLAGTRDTSASPVRSTSPDVVVVDLPKGAVDRYLADLPALLESAVATPRYRDGTGGQRFIDGYEIGQIKAGGVADQLGLRNGDVVVEVNGQPLDGMATVMRLFGELQSVPQAKVAVLRGGQRMTLVIDAKRQDR